MNTHPQQKLNADQVRNAAQGQWHNILVSLGADPSSLDGKHHPCPACGGSDRFRFDNQNGNGSYFCNQCGAGDGFSLAGKLLGLCPKRDFRDILAQVEELVGGAETPHNQQRPPKSTITKTESWEPITPVPDDAPEPSAHYKMGTPSQVWVYRDALNRILCYVCRFDLPEGGKQILPLTFCLGSDGKREWRWKGLQTPRPLYNLDKLASNPEAGVIFTEGEKAAEAAAILFPDFVATTSLNGAKSAGKSDFSALEGRDVTIWPDHDAEGQLFAEAVLLELQKVGVASVQILRVPFTHHPRMNNDGKPELEAGFVAPEKWDAADALADGWTPGHINLLRSDSSFLMPSPEDWKDTTLKMDPQQEQVKSKSNANQTESHFKVKTTGVWYESPAKDPDDDPPAPVWICSRLEITARTRDDRQGNHGRLLEFDDPDDHHHAWAMPLDILAGDGTECRRELLSMGLEITPNRKAREYLSAYIQASQPEAVARCVDRTGWNKSAFVLPDETIGESKERVLLQTVVANHHGFEVAGKPADWQRDIGMKCAGNSRLVFAVSCAFTPPLLHWVGEESGGFNFTGQSSTGKTTALTVAVSVWGGPERMQRWRATSNGLEAVALNHNDTLLCLDELAQVDPREAGEIAYMLANGTGKARSKRDGTAKKKAVWRIFFLSAGEIGLNEHMRQAGKRARAGQEVRLVDIPADAGAGHGLFENLHDHSGGADFSRALNTAARSFYGTPAREFIKRLVSNLNGAVSDIDAFRKEFLAENLPAKADGQAHRVAGRFALVAAAGELATAMGITGWEPGESIKAARTCLNDWIKDRGGIGPRESEAALAQVRLFFEQHGESRFSKKIGVDDRPTINRAGFSNNDGDHTEYWVLPEVFQTEICGGIDSKFVARLLVERGWIVPEKNGKTVSSHRLPGMGSKRCYHFLGEIMDGDTP